jgi:triacylglycerol lipase
LSYLLPKEGLWILALLVFLPPTALAGHKVAHCRPTAAEAIFPPDFPILKDREWGYSMGGWGGVAKGDFLRHPPVIFVHGNTRDAGDWDEPGRSVKQRFIEAGYSKQELWALSYNGKSTKGHPPESQCRTDNTSNVPDLTAFVNAVLVYTGASQADIIGHSLGVTLVRSMLRTDEELVPRVRKFVAIAGPNHGTTVCRRSWLFWFIGWQDFIACDEIATGSTWLQDLNRAYGDQELPGSLTTLALYDGTGTDVFYQRWLFGWPVTDQDSPALKGAKNVTIPGLTHDELRIHPKAITTYLNYLLSTP